MPRLFLLSLVAVLAFSSVRAGPSPQQALSSLKIPQPDRKAILTIRNTLLPQAPDKLRKILDFGSVNEQLALLCLEREGKKLFSEADLGRLLEHGKTPVLVRAAAAILANRRTRSAYAYLAKHLVARGAGRNLCASALSSFPFPAGQKALLDCAAQASPDDQTGLHCLQLLKRSRNPRAKEILSTMAKSPKPILSRIARRAMGIPHPGDHSHSAYSANSRHQEEEGDILDPDREFSGEEPEEP
jgi:hypothetical protein